MCQSHDQFEGIYVKQPIIIIFTISGTSPSAPATLSTLSFFLHHYPFLFWAKSNTFDHHFQRFRLPTTINFCPMRPKLIRISPKSNNFQLFLSHEIQINLNQTTQINLDVIGLSVWGVGLKVWGWWWWSVERRGKRKREFELCKYLCVVQKQYKKNRACKSKENTRRKCKQSM